MTPNRPGVRRSRRGNRKPDPAQRALMYLNKCEPAIQGNGGSDRCFKAACFAGPGFDLPMETMIQIMLVNYNPRCVPPWTDAEIRHKVEDAYAKETRRGWLLNASRY